MSKETKGHKRVGTWLAHVNACMLILCAWRIYANAHWKSCEMSKDLPMSLVSRSGIGKVKARGPHAEKITVRERLCCKKEHPHKCRSTSVCLEGPSSCRLWGAGVFSVGQAALGLFGPSCCELTWAEQTVENVVLMWVGMNCVTKCHPNIAALIPKVTRNWPILNRHFIPTRKTQWVKPCYINVSLYVYWQENILLWILYQYLL